MKRRVALGIALAAGVLLLGCPVGCSQAAPPRVTRSSSAPAASADATAQAQAALQRYFDAIRAGDTATQHSLVVSGREVDWHATKFVAGPITPIPVPSDFSSQEQSTSVRAFHATIRAWPGDGSFEPGDELDWTWFVIRDLDGQWRIKDWGM